MGLYGECFDNGMSGNCGIDCEVFLRGDCENGDEGLEAALDSDLDEESKLELIDFYG